MGDLPAMLGTLYLGSFAQAAEEAVAATPEQAFLVGVGLLLMGGLALRIGQPRIEALFLGSTRAPAPQHVTWGGAEIAFVAGSILVALKFSSMALGWVHPSSPVDGLLAMDVSLLFGCAIALVLAALTIRRSQPALSQARSLELAGDAMGFSSQGRALRLFGFGALTLGLALPAILGVMNLAPYLLQLLDIEPQLQAVLQDLLALDGLGLGIGLLLATIVGPTLEEVLFRGLVQPLATQSQGAIPGILITSIFFGAIHGSVAFLPVFGLSLVLGYLRHRSGSLLPAIVGHCLWNGGTMILSLSA
ncbi:MAG: membrane protease YdiL (CAAX protease family) [Planctomycetota bacterium]|jgi:membrane protease YdiL (CAAX protease family)